MNLFEISFIKFTLTDLFDLVLISFIFSYAYSYFRGTRGGQMLIGLLILFFAGAKMMVMVEMPSALRQFIVKCSIMIFV